MSIHKPMTEFEDAAMRRDIAAALKIESGNDSVWQAGLWASRYANTLLARLSAVEAERDAAVARCEALTAKAAEAFRDGHFVGERRERVATLAFLRGGYGTLQMMVSGSEARDLADAIERGDHVKGDE